MKIIGLSGKMGVGKSVTARELKTRWDSALVLSFAAALKHEAATLYGYDPQLNDSQAGKDTVVFHPHLPDGKATVRWILQQQGRKRRAEDPQYWTKKLMQALDVLRMVRVQCVIVDDIRFANEVQALRLCDAFLVRIEPFDGWVPGLGSDDESETALDNCVGWDCVLEPPYAAPGVQRVELVSKNANEILCAMFQLDAEVGDVG